MHLARSKPISLFTGTGGIPFVFVSLTLVLLSLITAMATVEHPTGSTIGLARVPHARSIPKALREDAIIVFVLRNGDIFFRQDRVAPEQLSGLILKQLSRGSERKVYIRADGRVRYIFVKEVVDAVRATGVEDVAFFAEKHPVNYFR